MRDVLKDVLLPWYNAYRFFIQNVLRLQKVWVKWVCSGHCSMGARQAVPVGRDQSHWGLSCIPYRRAALEVRSLPHLPPVMEPGLVGVG